MIETLWKVGAIVLLLGGLIFVHELGHFLAAKAFGVKVLRFSLGFGPKIVGFRHGETDYQVAALPLGGFVRMAGEDPDDEVSPLERQRTFLGQAPWKRSLIAMAGPGMNLALPVLIYFAVFALQREAYSSRVGEVEPDMPAAMAGLRAGDRIAAIDGAPVNYFHEVQALISPKWEQRVRIGFLRDGQALETTMVPLKEDASDIIDKRTRGKIGVAVDSPAAVIGISDPLSPAAKAGLRTFDRIAKAAEVAPRDYAHLSSILASQSAAFEVVAVREVDIGLPGVPAVRWEIVRTKVTPDVHLDADGDGTRPAPYTGIEPADRYVFSVKAGSAAEKAGLRRGDKLFSADGAPIRGWMSFGRKLRELASTGGRFDLTFVRDGETLVRRVELLRETWTDEFERQVTQYTFGAGEDTRTLARAPAEVIPFSMSIPTAAKRAVGEVGEWIRKTALVVVGLVRGTISFKTVGGPIMLVDIASRAAEAGRDSYLTAMAIISVNLGVMNLFPIPVLDGFLVLSAMFEWVRRRPLPMRARAVANYIGLGLLATLMVFVFKNDIFRYFIDN